MHNNLPISSPPNLFTNRPISPKKADIWQIGHPSIIQPSIELEPEAEADRTEGRPTLKHTADQENGR